MKSDTYCIVMTTFSDDNIGNTVIKSLIEKKLAACVQVLGIKSYFHWKGEINTDQEKLVLIKTKTSLYDEIEKDIISNHDYETPEIIAVPIDKGFAGYLNWISEECE